MRRVGAATATENEIGRFIAAGTAFVFAGGGVALFFRFGGSIRIVPFVGFLEVVALVVFWGIFGAMAPGPDQVIVDPEGLTLNRRGKLMRRLRWRDPRFSLELTDLSADPRANSLPRVALYSLKYARSGSFWAITPGCRAAIVAAAIAHGLTTKEESASVYHFPNGKILTLRPAPPQSRGSPS